LPPSPSNALRLSASACGGQRRRDASQVMARSSDRRRRKSGGRPARHRSMQFLRAQASMIICHSLSPSALFPQRPSQLFLELV
jgi:hypothetical protein